MQLGQTCFRCQSNIQIGAFDGRQDVESRLPVQVVDNLLIGVDVRADLLRISGIKNATAAL